MTGDLDSPGGPAEFHVEKKFPAFGLSRMRGGIFYGEVFGDRFGILIPVGRNQHHRPEGCLQVALVQIECGCQLYSVVGSEPMRAARIARSNRAEVSSMTKYL